VLGPVLAGLVSDQGELETLEVIRRWRSEGMSGRVIARRLDETNVPTKSGRPWCHGTVQGLLRRMKHAEA
jgi:hypothetical protein